jgi:hypothetical protein
MELSERTVAGYTNKTCQINQSAVAGDKLKISLMDGNTDLLKATCPNNKKWAINISVDIVETSA